MSPMEQLAKQEYERGYSDGKSDYFAAGVAEGEMRARQRMIANRVLDNQHPFAASGKPIDHIADAGKMVAEPAHPDDEAVDLFAAAMKAKLAKKRAEGRGGWEDKERCSAEFLNHLLNEHVGKGDPVDVGNLAMMLWNRGERTTAEPVQEPVATEHPLVAYAESYEQIARSGSSGKVSALAVATDIRQNMIPVTAANVDLSVLRPRNWTREMSDAWHRSIPNLEKAFDDLIAAFKEKQRG